MQVFRNNGTILVGTNAERLALTAPVTKEGILFFETDTVRLYGYFNSTWVLVSAS